MASAALEEAPAFNHKFRLGDIELDCGSLTAAVLADADTPGGHFGKVLCGTWRVGITSVRVAVKILASRHGVDAVAADDAFKVERQNLIAVRSLIDRARRLSSLGLPLSEPCSTCRMPHDLTGYKHLVYVYGVGTEPDLTFAGHPGPAHLIVMEELTGGTLQKTLCSPGAPLVPLDTLLRTSTQLAHAQVALVAAHLVHADVKVSQSARSSLYECKYTIEASSL